MDSKTLMAMGVRDIGFMSDSINLGGGRLGSGTTPADFQSKFWKGTFT